MAVRYQLVIDCVGHPEPLARFWAEALGYVLEPPSAGFVTWDDWRRDIGLPEFWLGRGTDAIIDPDGAGPRIWIQVVPDPKTVPNRLHLDIHASVRREPVDPQPGPGNDQLAHRAADVGVQAVPHHHERAAELLVGGVQEPGVVGLGETLALVVAAARAGAIDQPGRVVRPGSDQRRRRHARVAAAGHPHHWDMAAPSPGTSLWRSQALSGLVFEDQPGAQVRRHRDTSCHRHTPPRAGR